MTHSISSKKKKKKLSFYWENQSGRAFGSDTVQFPPKPNCSGSGE